MSTPIGGLLPASGQTLKLHLAPFTLHFIIESPWNTRRNDFRFSCVKNRRHMWCNLQIQQNTFDSVSLHNFFNIHITWCLQKSHKFVYTHARAHTRTRGPAWSPAVCHRCAWADWPKAKKHSVSHLVEQDGLNGSEASQTWTHTVSHTHTSGGAAMF